MVRFIENLSISSSIQDLINQSEKSLVLISPFLKIPEIIRKQLISANNRGVKIRFVVKSDSSIDTSDANLFYNCDNIWLYLVNNLHAKSYINEKSGILTSLNLYEFSQINNIEMGITFSKTEDPELYNSVVDSIEKIKEQSKKVSNETLSLKLSDQRNFGEVKFVDNRVERGYVKGWWHFTRGGGYCIRCGVDIMQNPNKPYCDSCFNVWKKYSNVNYRENYCHLCGSEYPTTFNKPLCNGCYMVNKDN